MLAGFVKRRKWLVGNLGLLSRRDAPPVESLAVLPFTTNAAGETSEYLADGITDRVILQQRFLTLRIAHGLCSREGWADVAVSR